MAQTRDRFLQTGTGAVARTADSKLKESVSLDDFGTDLQAAIDAVLAKGGGYVDITNDLALTTLVYMKHAVTLRGKHQGARILCSGSGQIVFDHNVHDTRYSGFDNLEVIGSSASVVPVLVTYGFELVFRRCILSGGSTSPAALKIMGGNTFTLDSTKIINRGAGIYSLHVDGSAIGFVNILNIVNGCRCDGRVLIDTGATGQNLVISGSDFSHAQTDPVLDIVRVQGLSIKGGYIEGQTAGAVGLNLQQLVHGFEIGSCLISAGSTSDAHIVCDGTGGVIEGNYLSGVSHSTNNIELTANSKYVRVGNQTDAGGGVAYPTVSDLGTLNTVFGFVSKSTFYNAASLELRNIAGAAATRVETNAGATYWLLPDAGENYFNILHKLPDDRYGSSTITIKLHYRGAASQPANNVRFAMVSDPLELGGTPTATTTSFTDVTDPDQTITTISLTDSVVASSDYIQISAGRSGSSGNDDYTSDIYLYGIEVIVTKCLGYVD